MHKVSIITSTRNRADLLPKAINSALKQTYTNIEIIIADDASSDDTQKVSQDLTAMDNRIKYVRQKERIGITATWKKAFFEYATGKFITVLNDDDEWIDPLFIQKAIDLFEKYQHKNIVAVFSNVLYKHYYETLDFYEESLSYRDVFPEFIEGSKLFHGDTFIHTDNGTIYKREVLSELDLFSHDIFTLDVEMMYKLMLVGNFCYIPTPTYLHHITQACLSKVNSKQFLQAMQSTKWIDLVSEFYGQKSGMNEKVQQWQRIQSERAWDSLLTRVEFDFEKFANHLISHLKQNQPIYIYGTGKAAAFLFTLFQQKRPDIQIIGFIDDRDKGTFHSLEVMPLSETSTDYDIVLAVNHYKIAHTLCCKSLERRYKQHQIHHILGY